jgi:hypothetical protein
VISRRRMAAPSHRRRLVLLPQSPALHWLTSVVAPSSLWCCPSLALVPCSSVPVVPSGGISSSTMQGGKKSSELSVMRLRSVSPGRSVPSFPSSHDGRLFIASSRLISSTYAMGGVHCCSLRRAEAKASARSNFRWRWRRDSALCQADPLRGFPLSRGIMETLEGASPLPNFSRAVNCCAGEMDTARSHCSSIQFASVIIPQSNMTIQAIKAGC